MTKFRLNNINSLQIFHVLQFGTAVLIGILLAQSGLPTARISIYEALLFIASLYCFFWVAGGQNTFLQLYPRLDRSRQARALFNVYFLFTVAGILTGGALFLSRHFVANELTSFDELPYLELLSLLVLFNCPTFLIHIFYLLLGKYRTLVLFGVINFSLQLAVVVVPIYLGYSLRISMAGLVGWAIFKFLWGLFVLIRYTEWKIDGSFIRMFLPLSLPLLLFAFIGKGSEYISGLVVTTLFDDERSFAIFRFGAREFPLAVLLVGALATSLIPEVSGDLDRGLQRIRQTTRRISHWLFPLSILSMLVSPILFPIIFNPDFRESAYIFNIFTLLLTSRILLPQVIVMGKQKNYVLTISVLVELVILTLLSIWWGKIFGLRGIAYAAVVAFMVDRIILITYIWREFGIRPGAYIDLKTYGIYVTLLFSGFLLSLQIG